MAFVGQCISSSSRLHSWPWLLVASFHNCVSPLLWVIPLMTAKCAWHTYMPSAAVDDSTLPTSSFSSCCRCLVTSIEAKKRQKKQYHAGSKTSKFIKWTLCVGHFRMPPKQARDHSSWLRQEFVCERSFTRPGCCRCHGCPRSSCPCAWGLLRVGHIRLHQQRQEVSKPHSTRLDAQQHPHSG